MKQSKKKIRISVSAILCFGFCMVVTLFGLFLNISESREDFQVLFTKIAEEHVLAFQDYLEHNLNAAYSLCRFFEGSENVTWDEFEQFIAPAIKQNPQMKALVWIPRVPANQRNRYEAEMRSYGHEDFNFKMLTSQHQFKKEINRNVYYPVYYFERYLFEDNFLGLNLGAFPEKQSLFNQIITEGQPIISDVLIINGKHAEPGTHCIYIPVYRPHQVTCTVEGRKRNLRGFIGVYLDLNEFMLKAQLASSYDIRVEFSHHLHHHSGNSHPPGLNSSTGMELFLKPKQLSYHANLPIADKHICINIRPGDNFIQENYARVHWSLFILGITTSILAGLYLNSLHSRREKAEKLVQQRTLQLRLEKEKSEQLAIQAQAANRAKDEFLANMSHEMRTPLNSVIGFSDLLMVESLDDEQMDYVNTISTNGKNLLELINSILDLARIESGRIELNSVEFDIQEMIEEIQRMLMPLVDEKELALHVDIDEDMPEILIGDSRYIRQCLINLLSNAIKFTEHGCIHLRARFEQSQTQQKIYLEVTDTGIGIPSEKQEEIFDAFQQSDNSAQRKYQGSGLGLSITKKLVEIMGGYIGLQSTVGKGTTFTIAVPIECPTVAPQEVA